MRPMQRLTNKSIKQMSLHEKILCSFKAICQGGLNKIQLEPWLKAIALSPLNAAHGQVLEHVDVFLQFAQVAVQSVELNVRQAVGQSGRRSLFNLFQMRKNGFQDFLEFFRRILKDTITSTCKIYLNPCVSAGHLGSRILGAADRLKRDVVFAPSQPQGVAIRTNLYIKLQVRIAPIV